MPSCDFIQPRPNRLKNVTKAITRVSNAILKNAPIFVTDEIFKTREAICNKCDQLKDGYCQACGCRCHGKLINKLRLTTESCPRKLWEQA